MKLCTLATTFAISMILTFHGRSSADPIPDPVNIILQVQQQVGPRGESCCDDPPIAASAPTTPAPTTPAPTTPACMDTVRAFAAPPQVVNFENAGTANSTSLTSYGNSYAPGTAFDGNRETYWASFEGAPYNQSIWFDFNNPITVVKFAFRSTDYAPETVEYGPIEYEFFFSDADDCSQESTWETICTEYNGVPFTAANELKEETIDNEEPHKCYGFKVTRVPEGDYGVMVTMHDIQFWDI